jgi:hypothetical protein
MDITKTLKMLMLDRDLKQMDVASEFNGTTKQNFNNLLRRNDYKFKDIVKIADIMGYNVKLQFVDTKTDKVIIVE